MSSARTPASKSDEPGHASGCEVPVELDYVQVLALVDCAYNSTRTAHPEFDDARDTSDLNRTLREIVGAFRPDSTSAPQMLRVLRQHIAAGFSMSRSSACPAECCSARLESASAAPCRMRDTEP